MSLRMKLPTQCHLWQKRPLSSRDLCLDHFTVIKTYMEESHAIRRLLQCRDCGQLYFYEFFEEIDWEGGNDPQYRTLIPVTTEAQGEALQHLSSGELLQRTPRLQSDWPAHAPAPSVLWVGR